MPKASVIIPTRNRATFLKAAIESVLRQTFQDFEIVIVDDASRDQTPAVLRSFTDPRIRCIRHETNHGQGASRNAAIKRSSGEYVALLDDDDEWLPGKLEKQVRLLDGSPAKVGMVYAGFYQIDAASKRVVSQAIPQKRGSVFEEMWIQNWIGTCSTVLLRRSCFEKVGYFDETLSAQADYDMWLRISKEFDIEYVREPLVFYTIHGNRISTNYESLIRGMEAQLRKYASFFALNRRNYSRRYFTLGINHCLNGDTTKGRDAFLRAIELYPFEIRHYYYLALSLFGAGNFKKLKAFRENHLTSHP